MSASLNSFKVLTFDCYGTLIDWETGIHAAMQSLLEEAGVSPSREALLEMFAKLESAQQVATPDLPYSDLLTEVHRQLADLLEVNMSDAAHRRFGASVADWPAFSDTVPALEYLQEHQKLAILSNVDNASFKGSNRRLEVTFDAVYTAQDIGSYKPNRRNFEFMLARLAELGFEKTDILHVAQSLFHDHQPGQISWPGLRLDRSASRHQRLGRYAAAGHRGRRRLPLRQPGRSGERASEGGYSVSRTARKGRRNLSS